MSDMEEAYFVKRAISAPESDLFEDVARLSIGTPFAKNLVTTGVFHADTSVGFIDQTELAELGRRIWNRISEQLHQLVCGGGKMDEADRQTILKAAGLSGEMVVPTIAAVISAQFGISAALATALAALILRRILKPAGGEVCKFWASKLET